MTVSETVSAGQLRAFIERIERVEEEIRTLNADKSDIYKELRGVGFDVKAVRQCVAARKLDSAEREERNAIFDLYWEALTGSSRVHVHEGRAPAPPHDPETGELTDTQEQPETADAIQAPRARPEVVAKSTTHIDTLAPGKSLAEELSESDSSGGMHDEEAIHPASHSPSPDAAPRLATADDEAAQANPTSSAPFQSAADLLPGAGKAGDVPPPSSPASSFNNPRCKSPDGCTFAHSRNSCWECTMAWATRPKDEQVRLWQKAMEAASETEAAA